MICQFGRDAISSENSNRDWLVASLDPSICGAYFELPTLPGREYFVKSAYSYVKKSADIIAFHPFSVLHSKSTGTALKTYNFHKSKLMLSVRE